MLTHEDMKDRYGKFYCDISPLQLDPIRVPPDLRPLIPFAELWGVADDLEREQRLKEAPKQAIEDLHAAVRTFEDSLEAWLAGPNAVSRLPTKEYVAFSAMLMASDYPT
jgi:hypothetical protein